MAELVAWVDGQEVGRFSERHVPDGSLFTFEYVEGASAADLVSLTMIPLPHQLRFDSRAFPPAFDMILPEGERRLRIEGYQVTLRRTPEELEGFVVGEAGELRRFEKGARAVGLLDQGLDRGRRLGR